MKCIVFLAFICITTSSLFAQDSIMVWTESRPLQWVDFNGQGKDTTLYDAEVFAEVRYHYKFYNTNNYSFDVFAIINRNTSWSKSYKQSEELLRHEQLHFDIAEVYARKLKEAFEKYPYTKNYRDEILQIFTTVKREYHLMQKRCDDETNHSLHKEKQSQWETYVKQELEEAKGRLYELFAKSNN